LEETGCVAGCLGLLPVMAPNPARYNNRIFTFIASNARQIQQQQLDATEDIEFEFLPLSAGVAREWSVSRAPQARDDLG
jgi:hypothetical protein